MCLKKGAYVCINKREKFCHYHKLSIGWFLWGLVILTFTKMGAYFFFGLSSVYFSCMKKFCTFTFKLFQYLITDHLLPLPFLLWIGQRKLILPELIYWLTQVSLQTFLLLRIELEKIRSININILPRSLAMCP